MHIFILLIVSMKKFVLHGSARAMCVLSVVYAPQKKVSSAMVIACKLQGMPQSVLLRAIYIYTRIQFTIHTAIHALYHQLICHPCRIMHTRNEFDHEYVNTCITLFYIDSL